MKKLPINDVLAEIKDVLNKNRRLILQAPAGAGKSTLVPISLLNEAWLEDKIIIMLEPRRMAARTLASQMSKLLKEEVGQSVGYQVKMESCFSKKTKILVVTEGILVRKIQNDQALEDVALIIFDEFHERSIYSDLSLALSLQLQEILRDDLKIMLMSATLNSKELSVLLDNAPVITSKGKMFDVENIYLEANIKHPDINSLNTIVLNTILKAIKEDEGDILVFLAGVKEIKELEEKLKLEKIDIFPLYSNLSKEKQDKAIYSKNNRKVILSTNIAQTSLTIEGIKIVIDSGMEKQIRFNPSNDMNHLEYCFISNDSAIQRAGRAGRLSSGKCYRLWHKNRILEESSKPEILRADLSSLLLDLSFFGVKKIQELNFLDIPSSDIIKASSKLLQNIDMLDSKANISRFGEEASSLGVHPRFANMILKANDLGFAYDACLLASLLIEKDIFSKQSFSCDIYERYIVLKEKDFFTQDLNTYTAKQVLKQAMYFYKKLKSLKTIKEEKKSLTKSMLGILLLFAYPNRLAKIRVKDENKYKLSNAKGAIINAKDSLFNSEYLVVPNINAKEKDSIIHLASSINLEDIKKYFSSYLYEKDVISYKKNLNKLDIRTSTYFLELEVSSKVNTNISKDKYPKLFIDLIRKEGLDLLTWSKKAKDLIQRVNFINENKNEFDLDINLPHLDNKSILENIEEFLEPYLQNVKTIKQLEAIDTFSMLQGLIAWDSMQSLDILAPFSIKVPSGSNIKIDYSNTKTPILAVKIQEIFGMKSTPKILNNQLSLQVHLLTPALRPIQITYDLESFWENSYIEVAKELRGKYKKHYWPKNPLEAIATRKTKKFM
ncbi:ATP-dependent helicase HrpB [Poseidonibacter ostreae]|uniref:ATP-dependent helicase HrpB n=3 Tax=Poseidonibacter ostreae TaxID=2654171 RepID=A0A6L4WNG7_9BACT|nr:ATP-dependent helicase HrpB [Poseidonibacter ostreae]KAB7884554.1 ATP-dependent helicase HrpB [Poseidonibacter ostreae]KAB7886972.1 ATP-dependent helicase HrpB [Poseidonibacter ostreae]